MFIGISKVEFKWLGLIILILIILGVAPYIVGYLKTPEGQVFLGISPFNIADQPVYYTYIEQVKNGSLTNFDFYTSEKQESGVFQFSWFVPGILARVSGISSIAAFHIWRIFLVPILVFALYLFVSLFFADKFSRFIAFFLALFGSGWGVYTLKFLPKEAPLLAEFFPTDLWVAESNTFLSMLVTLHFILSLIFLILIFYFWILYLKTNWLISSVFSGLAALILFNFHPYFVPLVYLVIGVNLAADILKHKSIFISQTLGFFLFLTLSLPAVFYHFYLLNTDFVLRMRSLESLESNFMPNIFAVLLGYGAFGALGLLGAVKNFKKIKSDSWWQFLYLWFFANIALFFVPFLFPRRLTEGFQIPLALFASLLIARPLLNPPSSIDRKGRKGWGGTRFYIFIFLFIIIFIPTTVFNFTRFHIVYLSVKTEHFFYREKGVIEAMRWLKENSPPDSVILAENWNGNILPVFSLRKVFYGHGDETIFNQSRLREVGWFFAGNNQDEAKKKFFQQNGINYIFWSEREGNLGSYEPDAKDYLKVVYKNERVVIYRVIGL